MVDLHHHLLFGLDDGSPDLETSVSMARIAATDGITHVVCTPHASSAYPYDPAVVVARLAALRAALAAQSIPLTLGVGCDFHLSYDNIQDALAHPTRYAINGHSYLLVELPDFGIPLSLSETFYEMRIAGFIPILTHPERNATLQRDSKRLADWVRSGILVQVTAGSVLGHMGKDAQRMSHRLLADRWVHFIATDAHNVTTRPPRMAEACTAIAQKYGREYADLLCTTNPTAVFNGQPLGPQPDPLHLFDEEIEGSTWWKRLFGR